MGENVGCLQVRFSSNLSMVWLFNDENGSHKNYGNSACLNMCGSQVHCLLGDSREWQEYEVTPKAYPPWRSLEGRPWSWVLEGPQGW